MILNCNECGICNSSCPMHKAQLKESQSPRGLIRLDNKQIKSSLFLNCANCGACKESCPSKVNFDIEEIRRTMIREIETEATRKILENTQKYNNPYGIDEVAKDL